MFNNLHSSWDFYLPILCESTTDTNWESSIVDTKSYNSAEECRSVTSGPFPGSSLLSHVIFSFPLLAVRQPNIPVHCTYSFSLRQAVASQGFSSWVLRKLRRLKESLREGDMSGCGKMRQAKCISKAQMWNVVSFAHCFQSRQSDLKRYDIVILV